MLPDTEGHCTETRQRAQQEDLANQRRNAKQSKGIDGNLPKSKSQTKRRRNYIYESYLIAVQTYKEVFMKYGHQDLAASCQNQAWWVLPQKDRQRDTWRFLPMAVLLT